MHRGLLVLIAMLVAAAGFARAGDDGVPELAPVWQYEIPGPIDHYAFDAQPDAGALVLVDNQLISLTPDGDIRWQVTVCDGCWARYVLSVTPTPDGGAWTIEIDTQIGNRWLVRRDAHGLVVLSAPMAFDPSDAALFGDDDRAIAVQSAGHTLQWQRVDLPSGEVASASYVLSGDRYMFADARLLDDGGVNARFVYGDCDIVTCPPPPIIYSVARLSADGDLIWHREGGGFVARDSRGGANSIVREYVAGSALRRITPTGDALPDIPFADVAFDYGGLYGPFAGRLVLQTGFYRGSSTLRSIDMDAHILATRAFADRVHVLDDSSSGLLISQPQSDPDTLQVIDPVSMDIRARFRLDDEARTAEAGILRDGTVYSSFVRRNDSNDITEVIIARFDAPEINAETRRQRAQAARAFLDAPAHRQSRRPN